MASMTTAQSPVSFSTSKQPHTAAPLCSAVLTQVMVIMDVIPATWRSNSKRKPSTIQSPLCKVWAHYSAQLGDQKAVLIKTAENKCSSLCAFHTHTCIDQLQNNRCILLFLTFPHYLPKTYTTAKMEGEALLTTQSSKTPYCSILLESYYLMKEKSLMSQWQQEIKQTPFVSCTRPSVWKQVFWPTRRPGQDMKGKWTLWEYQTDLSSLITFARLTMTV